MAHRSFAAALAELDQGCIKFDLGEDKEFSIPTPLPGVELARLGKLATTEFEDEQVAAAFAIGAYLDFFQAVMSKEDFKRFEQTCRDVRVPLDMLIEIAQYVMEEATGRPTKQRSVSQERSSSSSHLSPVAAPNEE